MHFGGNIGGCQVHVGIPLAYVACHTWVRGVGGSFFFVGPRSPSSPCAIHTPLVIQSTGFRFRYWGCRFFLPNTILWGRRVDSCARWSAKRCRVFCKTIDTYSEKSIIVQMKKHTDKAKRILELARHSGVVSTGEVRSEEIHHEYLRQLCREGKLVREGRGLSHRGLYDEVPRAQR